MSNSERFNVQWEETMKVVPQSEAAEGAAPKKKRARLMVRLKIGQHHFDKWLSNTSIHGIVHVFKGKSRVRRLLWLVVFVFAVIGCAIVLGFDISRWASNPTTTTITFQTETDGQLFPAVTVCNLNAVRRSYRSLDAVELLNSFANPTSNFVREWPFSSQLNGTCADYLGNIGYTESQQSLREAYEQGGHQRDDFIAYCGFYGDSNDMINCKDDFVPVLTSIGSCFTFNSAYHSRSADHRINRAGPMYGLSLVLNISQSEYSRISHGSVGAKVSIHAKEALPLPHVDGITISPGVTTYLAIETVNRIDTLRMTSCLKGNRTLSFFPDHSYAVSTCQINELYEDYSLASHCNCSLATSRPQEGPFANTRNCTVADICCLMEQNRNHYPSSDQCPLACQYTSYNTYPSYAVFSSIESAEEMAEEYNSTVEEIRGNLLPLYVYFDRMESTQLATESAYTFSNLLADMGGLLGLFIGASVISLLEVGILVFDFLKSLLFSPKLKKAVKELESRLTLPDVEMKEKLEDLEKEDEEDDKN